MLRMISKVQNQRENFSSYGKSPLQCRILIIIIHVWIGRKKKTKTLQRQQKAIEGNYVLCNLKWWKRSWNLIVVFSMTQAAATWGKDTETLGKQLIHLYSDTCIWWCSLYVWTTYGNSSSKAVLYCLAVVFCWHIKVGYSPPNCCLSPFSSLCSFPLPSQP